MPPEPTPADVQAVADALGTPAQQQPAPVTPQPAPQSQPTQTAPVDPFTQLGQPTEPVATPPAPVEPTQPTTPTEPVAQPAPTAPTQPAQPTQTPTTEPSYQQILDAAFQDLPEVPVQPDPEKVDAADPESIKTFFDELMVTAEKRFEANFARKQATQNVERALWEKTFEKYPSLRTNAELRDMVHAIRTREFQNNNGITPLQAADRLLTVMRGQYQSGVADGQVVTTIESVQPTGGQSQPVSTSLDSDKDYTAVQTGGEDALIQILDREIKAGNL